MKAIVPSYGRKLNGDVAATERELQYTSEVLGLNYDKPQAADSTPKPQLKPQPVQKEVADIAFVMMRHIRHGMPDVAYADKTRQRRIRQPARALDVGCGVTALSNLRGGALHSGVGLIRRASVASGNRLGR
ncbi:malate:quinone oxidoreductase [Escherichia coli]|uniref:Malate:quinone oxidoreductase n=12 Tax=Enterobacterales TaxID=91347 RepID=A0A377BR85_ECOLX|nr:malate:quinone oxidoreductase [Escherichia coli]